VDTEGLVVKAKVHSIKVPDQDRLRLIRYEKRSLAAEELYTAKVRQMEEERRLIPVVVGAVKNEQIPMVLRSALWVSHNAHLRVKGTLRIICLCGIFALCRRWDSNPHEVALTGF
jgi:hypothetical protein